MRGWWRNLHDCAGCLAAFYTTLPLDVASTIVDERDALHDAHQWQCPTQTTTIISGVRGPIMGQKNSPDISCPQFVGLLGLNLLSVSNTLLITTAANPPRPLTRFSSSTPRYSNGSFIVELNYTEYLKTTHSAVAVHSSTFSDAAFVLRSVSAVGKTQAVLMADVLTYGAAAAHVFQNCTLVAMAKYPDSNQQNSVVAYHADASNVTYTINRRPYFMGEDAAVFADGASLVFVNSHLKTYAPSEANKFAVCMELHRVYPNSAMFGLLTHGSVMAVTNTTFHGKVRVFFNSSSHACFDGMVVAEGGAMSLLGAPGQHATMALPSTLEVGDLMLAHMSSVYSAGTSTLLQVQNTLQAQHVTLKNSTDLALAGSPTSASTFDHIVLDEASVVVLTGQHGTITLSNAQVSAPASILGAFNTSVHTTLVMSNIDVSRGGAVAVNNVTGSMISIAATLHDEASLSIMATTLSGKVTLNGTSKVFSGTPQESARLGR